jgi:hypothetical protein
MDDHLDVHLRQNLKLDQDEVRAIPGTLLLRWVLHSDVLLSNCFESLTKYLAMLSQGFKLV